MPRSLAYTHRKIARQWHPTKNGDLTPRDVTAGSNKRVWWKCPDGPDHEWQTTVANRASAGHDCPFCSGRRVSVTNSLAACFPDVAAEWHPTKNGKLKPSDVHKGANKKVWWKCPNGPDHEWKALITHRTRRDIGCPFCAGRKASRTNSLAVLYPKIAKQWHPTKNRKLTPADAPAGSHKEFWWRCSKDRRHQWRAMVATRTRGRGCPFCAGKRVSASNSLAKLHPKLAAQWHPSRNGDLTPRDVTAGSSRRVWWKCPKGPDHEWRAQISQRVDRGSRCSVCAGRTVTKSNSLAHQFPEIAAQWHPKRNGDLTPSDVVPGSNRRVWWKCPDGPDHEWQTSPNNRTGNGTGCPFCTGARVSVTNSLASVHPQIAAQWHPTRNGKLTPSHVTAYSNKRVWWKCPGGRDHQWEATINIRTRRPPACPFCTGRRVSITNCLKTLFPKVANEWHPKRNGKLTPRQVLAASKMPVWWRCRRGHVWRATIHSRTVKGRGCPACAAGQAG